MKIRAYPAIVISLLAICIISKADNKNRLNIVSNDDSVSILQLEDQWCSGLIKRDIALFNRILAEEFIYTENDIMYARDSVIKYAAYGTDTVESARNEDMEVHLFGKTAAVTGWLIVSGHGETGKFNRRYRFTDTWLFIEGRWQIIAAHDYIAQ